MEQDVKYKPKESDGLDKSNAELTSDKGNVETELAALNYAERKARREALKVLNEYYAKADKAHSSSDGASSGINQITWLSCSARISMFLGPDDIDGRSPIWRPKSLLSVKHVTILTKNPQSDAKTILRT